MIRFLIKALMIRTAVAFVIIHIGLVFAVYGLASLSHVKDFDPNLWWILCAGVIFLYGGLVFGVLLLVWPIYSIMRKLRRFLQWRDWLLKELPQLISLVPPLIQALREAFASTQQPPPPRGPSERS